MYQLLQASGGAMPPGAAENGREAPFVARAQLNGGVHSGKVRGAFAAATNLLDRLAVSRLCRPKPYGDCQMAPDGTIIGRTPTSSVRNYQFHNSLTPTLVDRAMFYLGSTVKTPISGRLDPKAAW